MVLFVQVKNLNESKSVVYVDGLRRIVYGASHLAHALIIVQ